MNNLGTCEGTIIKNLTLRASELEFLQSIRLFDIQPDSLPGGGCKGVHGNPARVRDRSGHVLPNTDCCWGGGLEPNLKPIVALPELSAPFKVKRGAFPTTTIELPARIAEYIEPVGSGLGQLKCVVWFPGIRIGGIARKDDLPGRGCQLPQKLVIQTTGGLECEPLPCDGIERVVVLIVLVGKLTGDLRSRCQRDRWVGSVDPQGGSEVG